MSIDSLVDRDVHLKSRNPDRLSTNNFSGIFTGDIMKKIGLTQSQVALVDDEDHGWLSQWKWCAMKTGNVFYATRGLSIVNEKSHLSMHIAILGKSPKGFEVDHINGLGTDNRKENLRHVTTRQNQQNRKHQNSSSQYPGVSWAKHTQKWVAHIRINGIKIYLGLFINEKEAFNAYKQAVEALGEIVI